MAVKFTKMGLTMLKIKWNLVLLVIFSTNVFAQEWVILPVGIKYPSEYISIIGETNINCFECMYTKNPDDQNIYKFASNTSPSREKLLEVYIPVREFICNNYMMYDDFQSLLKANEYPYIRIGIDPSQVQNISYKPEIDLNISITITDITNIQSISCVVDEFNNSEVSIYGRTIIHLADYGIKPPVKFMGLVRVKDEVTISFSFNFIVS